MPRSLRQAIGSRWRRPNCGRSCDRPIDLAEADIGMAWWNSLSERERAEWLAALQERGDVMGAAAFDIGQARRLAHALAEQAALETRLPVRKANVLVMSLRVIGEELDQALEQLEGGRDRWEVRQG